MRSNWTRGRQDRETEREDGRYEREREEEGRGGGGEVEIDTAILYCSVYFITDMLIYI